jgi:hypothetical protein
MVRRGETTSSRRGEMESRRSNEMTSRRSGKTMRGKATTRRSSDKVGK